MTCVLVIVTYYLKVVTAIAIYSFLFFNVTSIKIVLLILTVYRVLSRTATLASSALGQRNSLVFLSSLRIVRVFLQPVSCHNTYLPGEKLHLKDLPKRIHRAARR